MWLETRISLFHLKILQFHSFNKDHTLWIEEVKKMMNIKIIFLGKRVLFLVVTRIRIFKLV